MSETEPIDSISRLGVYKLFGRFDHEITFADDQSIAIITAPNGYGKTVLLRIIDSFFNRKLEFFWKLDFESIDITLSSGKSIQIKRNETPENKVFFKPLSFGNAFVQHELRPSLSKSELQYLENYLPVEQVLPDEWYDINSESFHSTIDIIKMYADRLPDKLAILQHLPPWLDEVISSVDVHLVETQRLLSLKNQEYRRYSRTRRFRELRSVVEEDAKNLSDRISKLLQQYANKSQQLDQTFPKRIIGKIEYSHKTGEEITTELEKLQEKRDQLVSVGLLSESASEPITQTQVLNDKDVNQILAIYVKDTKQKLSVFDQTHDRIKLFKQIIDQHFSFKSIEIDSKDGFYSRDNDTGENIPLSELSSGEQHELVLIYDLLFRVTEGATILIDEPELSLHVVWQKLFITDLQEIQELKKMKVFIATHSPQIINDRWDLVQELAIPAK